MPILPVILDALAHVSRICGLETADAFPPGHPYARTRWNKAFFDIPSDMKPDRIDRTLSEAITNTPQVFAQIEHPTPAMQRALLAVIETRMRRACGTPDDLLAMLIRAYDSPYTQEAVPGLRAIIERSRDEPMDWRARRVLQHLVSESNTIEA